MGFAWIIHFILVVIGLSFGYYDYKKRNDKKLSIFMGANLLFVFIYGVIPLILMVNGFFIGKTDFYLISTIDIANESYLSTSILITIGYLSLIIGYLVGYPYRESKIKLNVRYNNLRIFGFILLVISALSSMYIASKLGGILQSLRYITSLRTGEVTVPSSIFLLLPLSITSFIIFYSIKIDRVKMTRIDKLLFIFSFIFSLYYILIFGGRLPFTLFLLLFPMLYMDSKSKYTIKNIAIIVIIGIIFLNYLEAFFNYISQGNYQTRSILDNIPRLVAQFSFPYINSLKVHEFTYSRGEFRYFIDFISWIINYIPKSMSSKIGLDQIPASYLVNSNNHLAKGIPTDIISFGYYQFALPGVIIISGLFGRAISYFDRVLRGNDSIGFIKLAKVRLFQIMIFYPMYADIEAFMRRRLDTVMLLIILVLFTPKKKSNGK